MNVKDLSLEHKLRPDLKEKLIKIKERAKPILDKIIEVFPEYTIHDIRHSEKVLNILGWFIPDRLIEAMSPWEVFFLACAAVLHDIGMIRFSDKEKTSENEIRKEHHKRSEIYINTHWSDLGFDDSHQAFIVGRICKGHRERPKDQEEYKPNQKYKTGPKEENNINVPMLVMFLQIADALDLDFERAPLEYYEKIYPRLDDKGIQEWERQLGTSGVSPSTRGHFIEIDITKIRDPRLVKACRKVKEDIQDAIDELLTLHLHHYIGYANDIFPRIVLIEPNLNVEIDRFVIVDFDIFPFIKLEEKFKENKIRQVFPSEDELDLVYFDYKSANELKSILETENCCLLSGPISSRKTTFALSFAKRLEQEYSTFYLEAREEVNYEELLLKIAPYDHSAMLFIIDDCHKAPNKVGKFINAIKLKVKKAKFLFISTEVPREVFERKEYDFFRILKKVKYITDPEKADDFKNVFMGIIEQFCLFNKIKDYKTRIGDINDIIKKCEKNFWLLNALLKEWKYTEELLSEVPMERIYDAFYEQYLAYGENIRHKRYVLAALSAIYQFGLPIPEEFLDAQGLNIYGSELEKTFNAMKRGLIFEQEGFYTIGSHPFFSEMVLRVLDSKNKLMILKEGGYFSQSRNDFTVEICRKYLSRVKDTKLLHAIYKSREIDIGKKLVEDETSINIIKEYLMGLKSYVTISMNLRILCKLRIAKEVRNALLTDDVLAEWSKNISMNGPDALNSLSRELYIFQREKRIIFLRKIEIDNIKFLYKEKISKVDIDTIFDLMKYFGEEFSNKVLSQLTEEEIKKVFFNSKDSRLYNFFINIRRLPRHFWEAWSEYLREAKKAGLFQWLSCESTNLIEIGKYVRITYWHKDLQPIYNRFFFTTWLYLYKLKNANLEEISRFISDIVSIKYKKNPLMGQNLACSIINPIGYPPLNYKGLIFDLDTLRLLRKAQLLIAQGRIYQVNSSHFYVKGFHGTYHVYIENDVIKCLCLRYKNKGICSHSVAVLLLLIKNEFSSMSERKIKESSLKGIQKFLQVADEMGRNDLRESIARIMEDSQFSLIEKFNEASLSDIGYFLWNLPHRNLAKYADFVTKNVNLIAKMKEAKIEEIIFVLWNLFEGDSLNPVIFNERILLDNLNREGRIGEKLALIGLFEYVDPDLVKKVDLSVIKSDIVNLESEVKRWFKGRRKRRATGLRINLRRELFSTFLFLFGIKGLRRIDEKYCFSVITSLKLKIERLIYQLESEREALEKIGKMNDKRKNLYNDVIRWLTCKCEKS